MDIQNTVLPSGLTVVSAELAGFETAGVAVVVPGGAGDETPRENGIAHFLEHMAFKGTRTRSALDIAREVEVCGSDMNAYTAISKTAYHITGLAKHLPTAMSILGDIVSEPALTDADIEMEKGVIQQEIKRKNDSPFGVCGQLLEGMCFPDHPLGRAILGSPESVASFTADDFRAFIARQYAADNTYVVAAGKVRHEEIVALAEESLSRLPQTSTRTRPAASAYHSGIVVDRTKPFEQVSLMLAFEGVTKHHPNRHAFTLLCDALGGGMASPLFQEVREKRGLVYSVGCGSDQSLDSGRLVIYAGTGAEHVEELLRVAVGELQKIAAGGVQPNDFTRAVNGALVRLATARERPMSFGLRLVVGHMNYGKWRVPTEVMAEIEAVTPEEVQEMARLVVGSAPALAMVGPVPDVDYAALLAP